MRSGGPLETLSALARSRSLSPLRLSKPGPAGKSRSPMRHRRTASRFDQENNPPPDPNAMVDPPPISPAAGKKASARTVEPVAAVEVLSSGVENQTLPADSDSSAKVVVRIRPVNSTEGERSRIVQKVSPNSLTVENQMFVFDSVFGPGSSQEDIFQLVGAPLVRESLAGFNTSIVCYGETGSGKTYTMWGPLSAMLDEQSVDSSQGIASRVFHMLFSEIQKMQQNSQERQINFQCRCSLLEIYNEQISDLLDPTQRNLEIKDDARNGFYVENLSEEYVSNIEDVTQVLVKGLSNRRVGATSINSKSSRSHVVLTCIIESWCKGTTSESFNSSKMSRINLVDLAGSERYIPDGASGRYKKEGRHIKKSLSKLGKLINGLAEVKQSRRDQNISHSASCLTHLLRDSLGGNAKITFICSVSPIDRCKAGTLSTLRFGQQAKCIENKAVINEITEDYVNDLTDQIRHLKEELIKEKTCREHFPGATNGFFKRHNVRGSLNLLRASLNRSLILPQIENDPEEEVVSCEDDVKELYVQLSNLKSSSKETSKDTPDNDDTEYMSSDESSYKDALDVRDSVTFSHDRSELDSASNQTDENSKDILVCQEGQLRESPSNLDISISPCRQSLVFNEPTLCTSPQIKRSMNKSFCQPSGDNQMFESQQSNSGHAPSRRSDHVRSSLQSSKLSPTESLACSLHRGLQIIDYHQQRFASRSSSVGFSFDYLKNSSQTAAKNDAGMQTISASPLLCSSCKQPVLEGSNMQIIPVSNSEIEQNSEALKRATELEKICSEQATKINDLNQQMEHYKQIDMPSEGNTMLEDEGKKTSFDMTEKNALLEEIRSLRNQLHSYTDVYKKESLQEDNPQLLQEFQLTDIHSISSEKREEEIEKERQRWTESESRWISLTEELRVDLESYRRLAENKDIELATEKRCSEELDDALQRAMHGHARMIEHYTELQENYTSLLDQHKQVMEGIAHVKKAAEKAGKKGAGSAFARALNAELSSSRAQKEKERAFLKEQNRVLKIQLRDTAEAVHAAGELLVKLREAEENASVAEEKYARAQQETERLRKNIEKMKNKHAMEMMTVKHYVAESRLPETALEPLYRREHEADRVEDSVTPVQYESQSWRTAFAPSYQ